MKKIGKIALVLIALMLVLGACSEQGVEKESADGDTKEASAEVIGTVNGIEIAKADYDKVFDLYVQMLVKQNGLEDNVKDMLVDEVLIKSELDANKVEVSEDDIEKGYKNMIEQLGGETAYKELLESNGISEDLYKVFSRIQTYREAHAKWYKEKNPVSDDEISKYYEENKNNLDKLVTSHILVETEKEAKDIKKRLDKGEDFETIAKECSTCPSGPNGGSLGEISPASQNYDPVFMEALNKLEVGQISNPVKSGMDYGYHLIKLDAKKEGVEDAREEITGILVDKKYMDYYMELKDTAEIKFEGDEEKAKEDDVNGDAADEAQEDASDKSSEDVSDESSEDGE